MGKKTYKMTE